MHPTIEQPLSTDPVTDRDAILEIGHNLMAAALKYRLQYPQPATKECHKFDTLVDDLLEFLAPRLNLAIPPPVKAAHKTIKAAPEQAMTIKIPPQTIKRKLSEEDYAQEVSGSAQKRLRLEPVMAHESVPMARSYAVYASDYGRHPDGIKQASNLLGSASRWVASSSSSSTTPPSDQSSTPNAATLEAAEALTAMRAQTALPHGNPSNVGRSTRSEPATPSVRRSTRLRSPKQK